MIQNIINLFLYLGMTLLSGFGIWEANEQRLEIKLSVAFVVPLVMILLGIIPKIKENVLANLYLAIGLAYGIFGIHICFKELTPLFEENWLSSPLLYSSFIFIYSLIFLNFVKETKLISIIMTIFGIFTLVGSLFEISMKGNWRIVLGFFSFFAILITHLSEIKKNTFDSFIMSKIHNFLKTIIFPTPFSGFDSFQGVIYISSVFILTILPFVSKFEHFILYDSILILTFGLLIVLNNKKFPILLGFWYSLSHLFFIMFANLATKRSIWVLVGAGICLGIAIFLKIFKSYIESKKSISDYAPQFLEKLKIEEIEEKKKD